MVDSAVDKSDWLFDIDNYEKYLKFVALHFSEQQQLIIQKIGSSTNFINVITLF